jgi:hypothetical protein
MKPVHTTVLLSCEHWIQNFVRKRESKKHMKDECITGWLYRNKGGYVV